MENRPQGRKKTVGSGSGKTVGRQGSGLGTGPVGRPGGSRPASGGSVGGGNRPGAGSGFSGRPGFTGRTAEYQHTRRDAPRESAGETRGVGGKGLLVVIALVAVLLIGGGGGLLGLFGGGTGDAGGSYDSGSSDNGGSSLIGSNSGGSGSSLLSGLSGLFGGLSFQDSSVASDWTRTPNTGSAVRTDVAAGAREKYTQLLGNGADTVTIMVYLCGTDLESKSGMATADLQEMCAANLGSNVNLLVYTGGCRQWKSTFGISNSVNQIYQVKNGKLNCLVSNDGSDAMTKPETLTRFLNYCTKNYPANRNILIFWDHGGGSLSGYGYDEKNSTSGSMTLSGIRKALLAANTTFDFIGFDACLMATLENGLMLEPYADYMIASEETEPGIGWYYTDWLTALSRNTSISTLELGKQIVDDFVSACNRRCSGQKTTLSVVDLAELAATVPDKLNAFATDTSALIRGDAYQQVSDARSSSREFAASSRIDQVDLVSFATNLGSDEGEALAQALLGAVKYNRTSSNMTNAYGLSIYFPYQKASKVSSAVSTYDAIGMDSEYSRCIQQFASQEQSGQVSGSGASTALGSLIGGGSGGGLDLGSLLGGLMSGRELPAAGTTDALVWQAHEGGYVLALSEEQWSKINRLELSVMADDGAGWLDLGTDNVFEFTDNGLLIGDYDGTWLAVDDQPVAYYYEQTQCVNGQYLVYGYVPVLWNGDRAELLICFDENGAASIVGVRSVYVNGETETVAKAESTLSEGDEITFIADYYSYNGVYDDTYAIARWRYHEDYKVENVPVKEPTSAVYLLTDVYNNQFWTEEIP